MAKQSSGRLCQIVTLADGTQIRVNGARGAPDLDLLQELADAVKAAEASRCHTAGPYPMPEIAQKIHGRKTYWCGRERGHDGPHRWPEDGTRWVWTDEEAADA